MTQLQSRQEKLHTLEARLQQHSPVYLLKQQQLRLDYLRQRLQQSLNPQFEKLQQKLAFLARELDAYSPLATLGRGYSLVKDQNGRLVQSAASLKTGQTLTIQFAQDQALVDVKSIIKK